jgi:hypothetical protein
MTRRRGPKAPPAVAAKATEGEGTTEVNLDAVARAERRCLSCAVDPLEGDHLSWCPDAMPTVGEAERDARDLEAAIKWQPPARNLPKLSAPEREQLARLFAARMRARGRPPRKLWTLREWRDREVAS